MSRSLTHRMTKEREFLPTQSCMKIKKSHDSHMTAIVTFYYITNVNKVVHKMKSAALRSVWWLPVSRKINWHKVKICNEKN